MPKVTELPTIKIAIPPELKERLKALAARENRSERAQALHLIAQALEASEQQKVVARVG